MSETVEQLKAAKALIFDPRHWCQGARARTCTGEAVWFSSCTATSWCSYGAILKVCELVDSKHTLYLLKKVAQEMGRASVAVLNDETNHATVMKMFDLAIEMAGE